MYELEKSWANWPGVTEIREPRRSGVRFGLSIKLLTTRGWEIVAADYNGHLVYSVWSVLDLGEGGGELVISCSEECYIRIERWEEESDGVVTTKIYEERLLPNKGLLRISK